MTSADGFKDPKINRIKESGCGPSRTEGHSVSPTSMAEKIFWCREHSRQKKGEKRPATKSFNDESELWGSGGTEKHFQIDKNLPGHDVRRVRRG